MKKYFNLQKLICTFRDVVRTIFNIVDGAEIVCLMKTSVSWKRGILGATYETPLRWLIKTMPGMYK